MKLQNIQIVFYFNSDIASDIFWFCKDLIGDNRDIRPIMFPFGQSPAPQPDMPLAIIPASNDSQIQISTSFIAINTNNVDGLSELGAKIIKVSSDHGVTFNRIGIVSSYSFPGEKKTHLYKKIFNETSTPELDFQYAQLSIEKIEGVSSKVNRWKRYFTALESTPDLLAETDINTLIPEGRQVNRDFLAKFIGAAQKMSEGCFKEDNVL